MKNEKLKVTISAIPDDSWDKAFKAFFKQKKKKILIAYYLAMPPENTIEESKAVLKENFETDGVIIAVADNKLEHTQYPVFEIITLDE